MAADYETAPECRWIEHYVKEEAPAIDTVRCGRQLNGDYEVWFQLQPGSSAVTVLIAEAEYKRGVWKEKIKAALENSNS